MAKIRFEGVSLSVTADAIEVDEVNDPAGLLKDLGLQGANVKDGVSYETKDSIGKAPPVPDVVVPKEVPPAAQIEELEEKEKEEVTEKDFDGVNRLRHVVEVFMDKGITDTDEIVKQCLQLKSSVAILQRVKEIEDRIPKAVEMWRETHN